MRIIVFGGGSGGGGAEWKVGNIVTSDVYIVSQLLEECNVWLFFKSKSENLLQNTSKILDTP